MSKLIDLTGQVYGRLTVICRAEGKNPDQTHWLCQCTCGRSCVTRGARLRNGHTKSCGCLYSERWGRKHLGFKSHGLTKSTTYTVWKGIIQRCTNPRNRGYADYGGRGITVCERWRSFENFLADMGTRPAGRSIDRIDNDGPYCLENCRWSSASAQANNKRGTRRIDLNGRMVTIREASEITGIPYPTIVSRINKGRSAFGNVISEVQHG